MADHYASYKMLELVDDFNVILKKEDVWRTKDIEFLEELLERAKICARLRTNFQRLLKKEVEGHGHLWFIRRLKWGGERFGALFK